MEIWKAVSSIAEGKDTYSPIEYLENARAIEKLSVAGVRSVATFADLPTTAVDGAVVNVENECTLYFRRSGSWNTVPNRGKVYAWGEGFCGKLGDGTTVDKCVPTQESTSATNWCAVTAGGCHTAAVKRNGELYVWGDNSCGELGDGTVVDKCVPNQECTAATDWCAVSAGDNHTAAVKTNGELYAWGDNGSGRLGDGTALTKCVPTQESTAATDWCAVSAGCRHTAAVKTTGELYAWGDNFYGNIGDGTTTDKCVPTQECTAATNWCAVAAGYDHTAAVKTTGELYAWGLNALGKLGDGTTTNRSVPTQESTAATDWCAVSAGCCHTAAVKTTGELYAWGINSSGQLGDGTTTSRCVPTQESTAATDWCAVSAGRYLHTAAVKITGELYAWGSNNCGQLGDGTVVDKCVPTQESTAGIDWCAVAAGDDHTAAITLSL